jgi:hypothetical protein
VKESWRRYGCPEIKIETNMMQSTSTSFSTSASATVPTLIKCGGIFAPETKNRAYQW